MMRGPIIHGVLLVVALALGYQTWTRDKSAKVDRSDFVLWQANAGDVKAIDYDVKDRRSMRIERRSDEAGDYLWASVVRKTKLPPKPPAAKPKPKASAAPAKPKPDEAPDAANSGAAVQPPSAPEFKTTTREFPVGDRAGGDLFAGFAPLRGLRKLGKIDDAQREDFGLDASDTQLTVEFGSAGAKSLMLGAKVYGGSDRYAVDLATGDAYVITGKIVQPLAADSLLRDGELFAFKATEVGTATVKTPVAEKQLVRGQRTGAPPAAGPHRALAAAASTWAYADSPKDPDQTLANFMNRVDKLTPSEYLPSTDKAGLTEIMRIDYAGKGGAKLGHLELYKGPGEREGTFEYYVLSERTRVLAKTHPGAAKRVQEDLAQLFAPAE